MHTCDVLIVGGGPAGSSCAWALKDSPLEVMILDRGVFPRDKICGGWITPEVLESLEIPATEYARERVLQPITGFHTSYIGGEQIETRFPSTVSYGILRREFDQYLLRRSGAKVLEGQAISSIERRGGRWLVNGSISARLLVGAAGHFCPVAKWMGASAASEAPVVAQEAEFELSPNATCRVSGDTPELFFCPDMSGYGWCFRKQNRLNVGLGRLDPRRLSSQVEDFWNFLRESGKIDGEQHPAFRGHAYLLYGSSPRNMVGDAVLLIGDAVGLAYTHSGEGIGPAVQSGLLAGETILEAREDYSSAKLSSYRQRVLERFGRPHAAPEFASAFAGWLARTLLASRWFTRSVVLTRWFLHGRPAHGRASRLETATPLEAGKLT